jgi:zinc transport system substrate-binding protein
MILHTEIHEHDVDDDHDYGHSHRNDHEDDHHEHHNHHEVHSHAQGIVSPFILTSGGDAYWQDSVIRIMVKQITTKPEMSNAKNGNFS